jgi:hypothetical protein
MIHATPLRLIFLAFIFIWGFSTAVYPDEKRVVGWVENIRIFPGNLKIKAKLDTGALNSSLHAIKVEQFERNGEKWVRFDLPDWQNRTATIEKKVIRTARIKEHDRTHDERPVIRIGICLGNVFKEAQVNLVDRSHFRYRMLIGRSFLKGSFVVDPGRTFTCDPQCKGVSNS